MQVVFDICTKVHPLIYAPGGQAKGGQGALSTQKNKKITRRVQILNSNST